MSKIAFLGDIGSFSFLAANEYFGDNVESTGFPDFPALFSAVDDGKADYGIIPIENSMAGSIHQNYDLLLEYNVEIVDEMYLRVSHNLLSLPGVKLQDIREVYSHAQPIAQCKQFLNSLNDIQVIPTASTSSALNRLIENNLTNAAVIGSFKAAENKNIQVLQERIEDNPENQTRFLIIKKTGKAAENRSFKRPKTSIVFTTKNIPGVLFKAIGVFALRDINLLKIESRPMPGSNFEYLFYLDVEGDVADTPLSNALNNLNEITSFERVLGTYEAGKLFDPMPKNVSQ